MSFQKDYKDGISNEIRIKNILKSKGFKIKSFINKYSSFDLCDLDNKCIIEVKKRNYCKGRFNDWYIGYDKIKKYEKFIKKEKWKDFKFILINSLTDGDYFLCYNDLNKNDYFIKKGQRYRRVDKYDIEKDNIHFYDSCFKKLNNY